MEEKRLQNNLSFRLMALEYRFRDRRQPPLTILEEIGVKPGMTVLDFGCGPGSFSRAAARMVGTAGQVYAVDVHPLAIEFVKRAALRHNIGNIIPVLGSDLSGVCEASIDVVLLYDVLHHLSEPSAALARFHQLLTTDGMLSVRDHRLNEARLLAAVAASGLFQLFQRNRWAFQFKKIESDEIRIHQ